MDYTYLILGIVIFLLLAYDFFYTTLSGSGLAFISKGVAISADKTVKLFTKLFGRKVFKFNGLVVNLMMLLVWIVLAWAGSFLVFSFNPEAIVNASGDVADFWERLYFTGFTLSTLGIGNYYPISPFFEVITDVFAIFGFLLFTTSMTYFISVSSALVQKRTLIKNISGLGKNPQEIASSLSSFDSSFSYQQFLNLQQMVNQHTVNHQAYPVVHFYTRSQPAESLSTNLAKLDEALSILAGSDKGAELKKEIQPLRSAILDFLENLEKSMSPSLPKVNTAVDPSSFSYQQSVKNSDNQAKRRRILERLLKSEGLQWSDVIQ